MMWVLLLAWIRSDPGRMGGQGVGHRPALPKGREASVRIAGRPRGQFRSARGARAGSASYVVVVLSIVLDVLVAALSVLLDSAGAGVVEA